MLKQTDVQDLQFLEMSGVVLNRFDWDDDTLECQMSVGSKFHENNELDIIFNDVTMTLVAKTEKEDVYSSRVKLQMAIANQRGNGSEIQDEVARLAWPLMASKILSISKELGVYLTEIPLFMPVASSDE
ncbi:hypothetical protein ACYATL_03305 [Actinotignum timonense]|uniref:hypothetical protein n=1 Tax=Actinotignum TaxID=1653174 RepID=UPI00254D1D9A|nr:hypothetical protein [Actinotignum timonense]MDK6906773.1 hypothetical protein [Actinotignum timonense]MDK8781909.1 hypothetical protein [Actinotignum timonense]MDY5138326.1 hypothetical protein [Actinotignum timonense]